MNPTTCLRVLTLAGCLVLGTAHAEGADETLKGLPAAVQKTIRSEGQQATLVSIDQNAKHGAVRYKVKMSLPGGKQRRLMIDANGKLFKLKNDVDTDKLPAPVHKTVEAQAQGAKIVRSTQVTQDGKIKYEVEFDVNGRQKVVLIDPAGALGKVEEVVLLSTLPTAAKSQVEKNLGHGKLLKIEAITDTGKPTIYEAQFETGAKKSEIKIAGDGKVIERE